MCLGIYERFYGDIEARILGRQAETQGETDEERDRLDYMTSFCTGGDFWFWLLVHEGSTKTKTKTKGGERNEG